MGTWCQVMDCMQRHFPSCLFCWGNAAVSHSMTKHFHSVTLHSVTLHCTTLITSSKQQHHSVTLHCIIISFHSDAQCSFQFHHTDRGTTPTLNQEDTAHPSN